MLATVTDPSEVHSPEASMHLGEGSNGVSRRAGMGKVGSVGSTRPRAQPRSRLWSWGGLSERHGENVALRVGLHAGAVEGERVMPPVALVLGVRCVDQAKLVPALYLGRQADVPVDQHAHTWGVPMTRMSRTHTRRSYVFYGRRGSTQAHTKLCARVAPRMLRPSQIEDEEAAEARLGAICHIRDEQ